MQLRQRFDGGCSLSRSRRLHTVPRASGGDPVAFTRVRGTSELSRGHVGHAICAIVVKTYAPALLTSDIHRRGVVESALVGSMMHSAERW